MAQRIGFIDILKGIAILLIVYGHIIPGTIPFLTEYVSTFHIPLFFFVSGLLFDEEKYKGDFKSFFISRSKSIVVPFFFFSSIIALLYMFVESDYALFLMSLLSKGWGGLCSLVCTCFVLHGAVLLPHSKDEKRMDMSRPHTMYGVKFPEFKIMGACSA